YIGMSTSADRLFGTFDSGQLRMVEHLDARIEAAINELHAFQSAISDTTFKSALGLAIQELESTVAPGIWKDHTHLNLQPGETVFDSWNRAIAHLNELAATIPGAYGSGIISA